LVGPTRCTLTGCPRNYSAGARAPDNSLLPWATGPFWRGALGPMPARQVRLQGSTADGKTEQVLGACSGSARLGAEGALLASCHDLPQRRHRPRVSRDGAPPIPGGPRSPRPARHPPGRCAGAPVNAADQLTRITILRESGILTQAEFEQRVARALATVSHGKNSTGQAVGLTTPPAGR